MSYGNSSAPPRGLHDAPMHPLRAHCSLELLLSVGYIGLLVRVTEERNAQFASRYAALFLEDVRTKISRKGSTSTTRARARLALGISPDLFSNSARKPGDAGARGCEWKRCAQEERTAA